MSNMSNLASKMRHRITIQEQVLTADGAGGNTASWTNYAVVWAYIADMSSLSGMNLRSEKNFAGQLQERTPYKITIRYLSGVMASMRVLYDGRIYNIRSINNVDEGNEVLIIYVEEGVAV